MPEKSNIPIKPHVVTTPTAEVKDRNRSGTKLVGMILDISDPTVIPEGYELGLT